MELLVERVRKVYGTGAKTREIISEISLGIEKNQFVTIVGPSGCGKSTLLMMMAGLLAPTSGRIALGTTPVDGPPFGLSVVFQDYSRSLFPWMTVDKNLRTALSAYRVNRAEAERRIEHALKSVGLPGQGHLYPWQMSGGMQQRVAIARALVVQPRVMLLDEPFAAVDAQTRADLQDLIRQVRVEYNTTIAFITHDIDEAVYLGDRILVLAANPGRVAADLAVDLPSERDQVETKRDPRFADLRSQVFQLVMRPKVAVNA